jgi:hypothetical protein
MQVGDLVRIVPITRYPEGFLVKGWDTFPGEYRFHRQIWAGPSLVVLLENRDVWWRILGPNGVTAWVEHYRIGSV